MSTKARVIATVRAAIKAATPRLITLEHIRALTLTEEDVKEASHEFKVNGVPFVTGWHCTEDFGALYPEGDEMTLQNLCELLAFLEEPKTKMIKAPAPAREYLGAE